MPTASLLNYSNVNIANGVVVPMCDEADAPPCTSGDITFLASVSGAHLVVDVAGYFHAGSKSFTLYNAAFGYKALLSNTTGDDNTANGAYALSSNTIGNGNTANGAQALYANTTGDHNTATGVNALFNNTTGSGNTAHGFAALYNNTTGGGNVALGNFAGYYTTGANNISIDNDGEAAESNTIRIGDSQTRAFVAGIRGITTGASDAIAVLIDSNGQLGTVSSSREVKQDIAALGAVSERLLDLRPVSFRYKEQAARGDTTPQFGLIAEEVAEVFPELVVYDARGRPETVKYHLFVPLLLNEVQRLDKAAELVPLLLNEMQRQEADIAALRRRLGQLEPLARDGPAQR